MKTFISLLLTVALAVTASAQQYLGTNGASFPSGATAGVIGSQFNGGTNNLKGATTNFYFTLVTNIVNGVTNTNALPSITFPVAMHPNAGASLYWFTPVNTTTNGSNVFKLAKSYDNGQTYETTPSILLTNVWPTALQQLALGTGNTNVSLFDISCSNATHIGIVEIDVVGTASATNYCTNVIFTVNQNNPTVWTSAPPK